MNILDSVKVDDTRWQIVYNASDLEIYYKTDLISRIDTISFSEFNLSSNKYLFKDFYSIKASEFNELSKVENNKYLNSLVNVFARSDKTEILSNKINNLIK
jgi:hypothetical protein